MAINSTRLTTTGIETVFTATGQQVVALMYICNTSASPVSVNVYVSNGSAVLGDPSTQIYSELEITGNDTYVISTEKLFLDDTNTVGVNANVADVVSVTVSSIDL